MDRDGHGYEDGCGPVIMQCPCSSATSSSSSNSEMRPRAMARAVGSQKSAVKHRMTKHDYELMISYLEVPDNFNGITGGGRKTKIGGKNFTKTTAFGHMAVSLCAHGFPTCNGSLMGKKYYRYLEMYKKARTFYLGTGAGLTDADVAARITLEEKMNRQCHFFMRMHALYDAEIHELSGDEEEAADQEEDPMDFLGDADRDAFENGTAVNPEVDDIGATAADNDHRGPGSDNQTARSALDVDDEPPEVRVGNARQVPSRGVGSQHSGEDMRSSGRRGGRDKPPPPERKNSLISAYEEQVKEKLILRKAAQEHKICFRDAILIDRRQAREAKQLAKIAETIEAERRARQTAVTARPNPSTVTNIPSRGHVNVAYICCMLTHKNDVVEFVGSMALLSGGNVDRIWKDDEVVVLIHAVRDVWTAQMQDPTTLRIWDVIVSRLADAGIQCSSLQAKFKWDSVFSDQMATAAKTEAEVFYSMSDEERTRSGLPAKYLKLWFDDISSFIRWKPIIWQTAPRPVL
ncbi:hypothetical protein R1sor_002907 [Riccia sorocarpa]|uniref:Transposase n=1 Tax=Riccia sorocarpa TaxID=122646 RepID=A0ABD3H024_9MARC